MDDLVVWAAWGAIVTFALCWMMALAYMALGPSSRKDKTKTEDPSGVDEPKEQSEEERHST